MKEIIKLIIKYHFTIVFIILESICLWLIVRHNDYQRVVVSNYASDVVGGISFWISEGKNYTRLNELNQHLAEENVQLRNQLEQYRVLEDTLRIGDYSKDSMVYEYIDAKAVNVTLNRMKNYIMINRGSREQLTAEMAVISPRGVVGLIQRTSTNYSTIIPLINIDSRLSAKIKKNNAYGALQWDGKDYRYSYLKDIPHHVDVQQGDTIVTSGFSTIFPEGLMIGIVEDVTHENANFLLIKVALATNFESLSELYVIRNKFKDERKKLEEDWHE